MCNLCKGTGGINLKHSWGLETVLCPNSNCDFDREKAIAEIDAVIDKMRTEIYSRRKRNERNHTNRQFNKGY